MFWKNLWTRLLFPLLLGFWFIVALTNVGTYWAYTNVVWNRQYKWPHSLMDSHITNTNDNGYLIGGMNAEDGMLRLIKTDSRGSIEWEKIIEEGDIIFSVDSILNTNDDGYMVLCTNIILFQQYISLIKITSLGEVEWLRTFDYWDCSGNDLKATSDGCCIIVGKIAEENGNSDLFIMKTGSDGTLRWHKQIKRPSYEWARSVEQLQDGDFLVLGVAGSTGDGRDDVWLLRLNPSGNLLWERKYGGRGRENAFDLLIADDGGFLIVGSTDTFEFSNQDMILYKIDSSGEVEWKKTYGGRGHDLADSIIQSSNGGYVISGYTGSFGNFMQNSFVVRTDALGDLLWMKNIGSFYTSERAWWVFESEDGGLIIGGEQSPFFSSRRLFLMKINVDGGLPTLQYSHYLGWGVKGLVIIIFIYIFYKVVVERK